MFNFLIDHSGSRPFIYKPLFYSLFSLLTFAPQPSQSSQPPEMFPRSNSMVTLLTPPRGIPPFIVQK